MTPPWYVLTGAPSSGKSSLLNELGARGYRTVPEAARSVIEREVAAGKDFMDVRAAAADFQRAVLTTKMEWEAQLPKDEIVFLDRGIPDSAAYYEQEGIPPDDLLRRSLKTAAYRKVFVLDLISRENFIQDGARTETWEGAIALDAALERVYRSLGYDVVRVPPVSISERADRILANL